MNRTKALCLKTIERFYNNLESLYQIHHYELIQIWNCDEIGAQANKNVEDIVLAKKGPRSIHTMVPNERLWTSILVAIYSVCEIISRYIFKKKRPNQEYIVF